MEFVTNSEFIIGLAWWTGVVSLLLSLLLIFETFFLHSQIVRRSKRAERFRAKWQPLLFESLGGLPKNLPPIKRRDEAAFLTLWNYLQESLRAEAKEELNRLAYSINIDAVAMRRLEEGSANEQLLAINTLGWLQESQAWSRLEEFLHGDDTRFALLAAKALIRIDAERAIAILVPLLVRRESWSLTVIAEMLRVAGADIISEPLARAAFDAPTEDAPRLIRLLALAHPGATIPVVRKLIGGVSEIEVVTACLHVLQDTEELDTVRRFLKDDRWQVRLQAAACLGRIGTEEDEPRLIEMTGDLEWWVRYRSAQALANLPSMTSERLAEIAENHPDKYARDIIRQVVTERQVAE